jgi:hypothetical protein
MDSITPCQWFHAARCCVTYVNAERIFLAFAHVTLEHGAHRRVTDVTPWNIPKRHQGRLRMFVDGTRLASIDDTVDTAPRIFVDRE